MSRSINKVICHQSFEVEDVIVIIIYFVRHICKVPVYENRCSIPFCKVPVYENRCRISLSTKVSARNVVM